MSLRTAFLMSFGLVVLSLPAFPQGVCVPQAIKAHSVQGYVLWKANWLYNRQSEGGSRC